MIFDDPLRDEMPRRLAESHRVKGVIAHIDSPGGAVAGPEALYQSLREVAAAKPVVAVRSEAAVSGGRVFTGRQAVDSGLIDAIGDERTARDWLTANRDLAADLKAADDDWNESPPPWPVALREQSLAGFMTSRPVVSPGTRLYAIIQWENSSPALTEGDPT